MSEYRGTFGRSPVPDRDGSGAGRRWRGVGLAAVAGGVALILVLGMVGWALATDLGQPAAAAWRDRAGQPTMTGAAVPIASATPSPSPGPTASSRPSPTKRATARPTPTRKPPPASLPPPPNAPTAPTSGPGCPSYAGPKAGLAEVKAALTGAAQEQYWRATSRPVDLEGELPVITVPFDLMKAVAWQESGWQSTIIACDGGIGTMQIMPGTANWMNNRFGTAYDVDTLAGNTALGAEYIEWLIMYFGLYYFGSFDLSFSAPVGVGGADLTLLEAVVSAYNVGPGTLENDNGTPDDDSDDTLEILNPRYVDNVIALMTTCVCLTY